MARESVRGAVQLVFGSVDAITSTVEAMHETIARAPMPWAGQPETPTRAHGIIAASVYSTIRGVNGGIGRVLDRSLALLPDTVDPAAGGDKETRSIAAVNGVLGDRLEDSANPLATSMTLRTADEALSLTAHGLQQSIPRATANVVISVHGLCLSELNWWRRDHPSIGDRLQEELGWTPLYLRYNTGRHISSNGREFADLLERLCRAWPVPIESLTLIGHSMGGLVIRSACWYATQAGQEWLGHLKNVVCLGTPHHGSMVDATLRSVPYIAPFAFGERLSAGIQDLRHGDLLDEDWQDKPTGFVPQDTRRPVPLLPGVDYYFVAATVGQHEEDPLGHALGDLLVRLGSASGAHDDDLRHLHVEPDNCRVFHEKHHFDLLDDRHVHQQLIDWFRAPSNASAPARVA